jgi:hypothetical protein
MLMKSKTAHKGIIVVDTEHTEIIGASRAKNNGSKNGQIECYYCRVFESGSSIV